MHSTRARITFSFLFFTCLIPAGQSQQSIQGFTPAHAISQAAQEQKFKAIPSPEEEKRQHRIFTAEPHIAGSPRNNELARYIADEELEAGYDGHANCFIETGFHKALLIDFNYETEPLPGHFPTAFGLPLLRESRLNHLGKLAFQWVYWHALLPGRELPGIGPTMPEAGKRRTPVPAS